MRRFSALIVIGLVAIAACSGSGTSTSTKSSPASSPTTRGPTTPGPTTPGPTTPGPTTPGPTTTSGSAPRRAALTVTEVADPPLDASFTATLRATYPQVRGAGLDLTTVNSALRAALTTDERAFSDGAPPPCPTSCPAAFYKAAPDVTAASAGVVSVLASVDSFYPGAAHPYQHWISITLQVPSGRPVRLVDLLRSPPGALRIIARTLRANLLRDPCIAQSWQGIGTSTFPDGVKPTLQNYKSFALTPSGLEIGVDQGQVAPEVCSGHNVLVPWKTLRSSLTSLGNDLVAAAVAPAHR